MSTHTQKPNLHRVGPDEPADTQMMGIMHSALRRDMVRVRLLLGTPDASGPRRAALAEHLLWLMHVLHDHHSGEDDGLYPLVLRRNPGSAELVERMDADHGTITPAMDRLSEAARQHLADQDSPDDLLAEALDGLTSVLLPHLEREEQVMMPVVSSSITEAEWRAWDEEFNLKPKGLRKLALEGHWVLDGLDEESRDHVVHLVPPVPRFILIKLMGGAYRRRRAVLWDGTPASEVPSLPIGAEREWVG
jgi:hemerythrin superfamily protein